MILQLSPRLPTLFSAPYVARTGSTIAVGAGGDFQAALNSANPGDLITLNAGSTYTGNYTLPAKAGSDYIYIASSAALTAEGTRVSPATAAGFPKIVAAGSGADQPAFAVANGASFYRLINVEVKPNSGTYSYGLCLLGPYPPASVGDFPHHVILDRCYIHGDPTTGGKRGVLFAGSYQAVIDSYVSDWKGVGQDTQAIGCLSGFGPYKIRNSYLEGAGENVMFGGGSTFINNLTPSDIEVVGNYFFKPRSWQVSHPSYAGTHWSVKNNFELKHACRVLITDNLFENCWLDSQNGYAVVLTVRNDTGLDPWTQVTDITFLRNRIINCDNGINLLGCDDLFLSQFAQRILIEQNVLKGIGTGGSDGIPFQIIWNVANLCINHNTVIHTGATILTDGQPSPRFTFTNNICLHNTYGIIGSGYAPGNATIAQFFPGADIRKNVIVMNVSDESANYPVNNFYPLSSGAVGFVDYPNDLLLAPSSAYKNAATDGTDIGAHIATAAP